MSTEPAGTSTSDHASIPDDARLVRLCREVFDDQGTEIGKRIVAWALAVDCGPTVTIETDRRCVCVWDRLDDAVQELDAFIDGPYNHHPVVAG